MRLSHPLLGNQQKHIAAANIDHAMENTSSMVASNRHTDLLSNTTVTTV